MFDDYDRNTSDSGSNNSNSGRRAFSPNFDVHETEHEYVLEGELPGLSDKNNVSIEFTDDKTILVHGKIERNVKRWSDDQGRIQTIEGPEEQKRVTQEGEKGSNGDAKNENKQSDKQSDKNEKKQSEKRPKYWVTERSVGEFSRSFSFPGNIDIDRVKASLDHGILKIVVPKLEKKAGRRIEVN